MPAACIRTCTATGQRRWRNPRGLRGVRQDVDDEFVVYPFRRQLVEETLLDEPLPQLTPRPEPAGRVPARPAPPRRRSNPLKWAAPLAVAVFLVALAGAATISHPTEVQDAVVAQIAPAEAEAAPKPLRHKVLQPKHVF